MASKITFENANISKYLKVPFYTNLSDRTNLGNPVEGEMIYVSSSTSLYYYNGTSWEVV